MFNYRKLKYLVDFYFRMLCMFIFSPFSYVERRNAFKKQELIGFDSIPIFIINFNRVSYIKNFINDLKRYDVKNIHIIDNASTYPPLLEYYKTIDCEIHYMPKNYGHKVFWLCNEFDKFRNDFYIVTDPDVELLKECPRDFVKRFFYVLKKYHFVRKVGFSLKIDDIPSSSSIGMEAVKWEKQFWDVKLNIEKLYYAPIDTTFALYMPDYLSKYTNFYKAFRTDYPYQVRHLPWYQMDDEITEEDIYYSEHKKNGWWDITSGPMPDKSS